MTHHPFRTHAKHCYTGLLTLLLFVGCDGAHLDPTPDNLCDGVDDDGDGRTDEAPPCNGCPAGTEIPENWVCIPVGTFVMGSPDEEAGREQNEGPQFQQRVIVPFLAAKTEVTQAEWRAFAEFPREEIDGCDNCPARAMNWFEATQYANARSAAEGFPVCYASDPCRVGPSSSTICPNTLWRDLHRCTGYRLPSESEWEFMARAGTATSYWFGDDPAELPLVAHFGLGDHPRPVAGLRPSPWGLFDVHGNVAEWTWNQVSPYPLENAALWAAAAEDSFRVARGGSFLGPASGQRSAGRITSERASRWDRSIGLRLVRSLPPVE